MDELISRVSEFIDDAILITDAGDARAKGQRILWCNDALASHTGYGRHDLIGQSPRIFQGPGTDELTVRRIGQSLNAWAPVREQLLNYRKDGSSFWVDLSLRPVSDEQGSVRYWIAVQRDVTALLELQREVEDARATAETAQKRLLTAIEALPDAFVIYDKEDRLLLCNSRYKETYAASTDAIRPGAFFEDIIRYGIKNGQYPEAKGCEEEWLRKRLARHRKPCGPIEQELPGDRYLQIHEVRTPLGDTVGFRSDVTLLHRQKRALEAQAAALQHAAFHDQLTDLPNRKRLHLELEARLARSASRSAGLCVMHVDLDRFKEVNDTLGHPVGDEVLRKASQVMCMSVRKEDLVARVGGDEFVVVMDLAHEDPDAVAQEIADNFIAKLRLPMFVGEHTCSIGASVGVAFAKDSLWKADRMIGNADIALYEAKRSGKGKAIRFQPSMRGSMERRHALMQDIERAVEAGEFVPHLQPKVSMSDGTLIGFEALVRWRHPTRGILTPPEFIELAEETGLLQAIDRATINGALDALVALRADGWSVPHVAVNASESSLRDPEYAADLKADLAMRGLGSDDLRIEVVEDTIIAKPGDQVIDTLQALYAAGFRIELDDFGTGYASLSNLATLNLTGLKIDLGLVQGLDDPRTKKITEAIVGLARNLRLQVTAEGVETPRQFAELRALGCNIAQGYCIARPLAVEDVTHWLANYGKVLPEDRRG